MTDDKALLRRYAWNGDQEAFAELVRLRINLVYSAALRQTGGDKHLAQDVTQAVFVSLARAAPLLERHPTLAGWLYTTTRFLAAKAVRSHQRWCRREQESQAMTAIDPASSSGPDWEQLRPLLDATMHRLSDRDREAILLRYFQGLTFAEIGKNFNLTENSARMRVERALEKLRIQLEKQGVTSAVGALGLVLGTNAVVAAPAGLAAAATSASFASVVAGQGMAAAGLDLLHSMSMTKLKASAAVAIVALCLVGTAVITQQQYRAKTAQAIEALPGTDQAQEIKALTAENKRLQMEIHRLTSAGGSDASGSSPSVSDNTKVTAGSLNALELLTDLQKEKLLDVSHVITLVNASGTLSPAFMKLFALSKTEADTLQQAIDGARHKIGDMAVANASVSQNANGSVVIHIMPFEGGAAAYDQLMNTFSNTLGPDRYSSLLSIGESQITEALNNFGGEDRTVTITPEPATSPDGVPRFLFQDAYSTGPGHHQNNTSGPHSSADISARLGALGKLVPPSFLKQ